MGLAHNKVHAPQGKYAKKRKVKLKRREELRSFYALTRWSFLISGSVHRSSFMWFVVINIYFNYYKSKSIIAAKKSNCRNAINKLLYCSRK